jgi:hypothetical protein
MAAGEPDLVKEYREYLERFEEAVGDRPFGAFVKHHGRLVRKLRYEEFEPLYREYFEVARAYFDSVDRGDTINDVVVKLIRERATELFLASPV